MSKSHVFSASSALSRGSAKAHIRLGDVELDVGGRLGAADTVTPVDLMVAAVASCMVLSVRSAAALDGSLPKLRSIGAVSEGSKAEDQPSRLRRIVTRIEIDGDLDEEKKRALVAHAETLCTVGNSILNRDISLHAELAS